MIQAQKSSNRKLIQHFTKDYNESKIQHHLKQGFKKKKREREKHTPSEVRGHAASFPPTKII